MSTGLTPVENALDHGSKETHFTVNAKFTKSNRAETIIPTELLMNAVGVKDPDHILMGDTIQIVNARNDLQNSHVAFSIQGANGDKLPIAGRSVYVHPDGRGVAAHAIVAPGVDQDLQHSLTLHKPAQDVDTVKTAMARVMRWGDAAETHKQGGDLAHDVKVIKATSADGSTHERVLVPTDRPGCSALAMVFERNKTAGKSFYDGNYSEKTRTLVNDEDGHPHIVTNLSTVNEVMSQLKDKLEPQSALHKMGGLKVVAHTTDGSVCEDGNVHLTFKINRNTLGEHLSSELPSGTEPSPLFTSAMGVSVIGETPGGAPIAVPSTSDAVTAEAFGAAVGDAGAVDAADLKDVTTTTGLSAYVGGDSAP